ncbi:MAG: hypothetical protein AB1529_03500 [Candidatus Micrarchaeota archaeon]
MRLLAAAIVLLLFGCLQQAEAPQAPEQPAAPPEPQQEPPEVQAVEGNITELPGPAPPASPGPENATNMTPPPDNQSGEEPAVPPQPPPEEGIAFGNGRYELFLDDISVVPVSDRPCGIFSIRHANGTLIEKTFICPGDSETFDAPEGTYRIFVQDVAAGYTKEARWAKVIIYG